MLVPPNLFVFQNKKEKMKGTKKRRKKSFGGEGQTCFSQKKKTKKIKRSNLLFKLEETRGFPANKFSQKSNSVSHFFFQLFFCCCFVSADRVGKTPPPNERMIAETLDFLERHVIQTIGEKEWKRIFVKVAGSTEALKSHMALILVNNLFREVSEATGTPMDALLFEAGQIWMQTFSLQSERFAYLLDAACSASLFNAFHFLNQCFIYGKIKQCNGQNFPFILPLRTEKPEEEDQQKSGSLLSHSEKNSITTSASPPSSIPVSNSFPSARPSSTELPSLSVTTSPSSPLRSPGTHIPRLSILGASSFRSGSSLGSPESPLRPSSPLERDLSSSDFHKSLSPVGPRLHTALAVTVERVSQEHKRDVTQHGSKTKKAYRLSGSLKINQGDERGRKRSKSSSHADENLSTPKPASPPSQSLSETLEPQNEKSIEKRITTKKKSSMSLISKRKIKNTDSKTPPKMKIQIDTVQDGKKIGGKSRLLSVDRVKRRKKKENPPHRGGKSPDKRKSRRTTKSSKKKSVSLAVRVVPAMSGPASNIHFIMGALFEFVQSYFQAFVEVKVKILEESPIEEKSPIFNSTNISRDRGDQILQFTWKEVPSNIELVTKLKQMTQRRIEKNTVLAPPSLFLLSWNDFLVKEFPFHVLLNQEGVIKHLGRNLKLLFPTLLGDDYTSYMTILYPNVYVNGDADLSVLSFDHSSEGIVQLSTEDSLRDLVNTSLVTITLRGYFFRQPKGYILFVGAPLLKLSTDLEALCLDPEEPFSPHDTAIRYLAQIKGKALNEEVGARPDFKKRAAEVGHQVVPMGWQMGKRSGDRLRTALGSRLSQEIEVDPVFLQEQDDQPQEQGIVVERERMEEGDEESKMILGELELHQSIIDELFPFHFRVSSDMMAIGIGPALQKVFPEFSFHSPFTISQAISIVSPKEICGPFSTEPFLYDFKNSNIVLSVQNRDKKITLRGAVYCCSVPVSLGSWMFDQTASVEIFYFLCSPVFTSLKAVSNLNLSLLDFSAHEPVASLLLGDIASDQRKVPVSFCGVQKEVLCSMSLKVRTVLRFLALKFNIPQSIRKSFGLLAFDGISYLNNDKTFNEVWASGKITLCPLPTASLQTHIVYGHSNTINNLLQMGAGNLGAIFENQNTILHEYCAIDRVDLFAKFLGLPDAIKWVRNLNSSGDTPLAVACRCRSVKVLPILVQFLKGSDFQNCRQVVGTMNRSFDHAKYITSLHLLCKYPWPPEHEVLFYDILHNITEKNTSLQWEIAKDKRVEGYPLHWAAAYGNGFAFRFLVRSRGQNINHRSPFQETPLWVAADNANWTCFLDIQRYGGDQYIPTSDGAMCADVFLPCFKSEKGFSVRSKNGMQEQVKSDYLVVEDVTGKEKRQKALSSFHGVPWGQNLNLLKLWRLVKENEIDSVVEFIHHFPVLENKQTRILGMIWAACRGRLLLLDHLLGIEMLGFGSEGALYVEEGPSIMGALCRKCPEEEEELYLKVMEKLFERRGDVNGRIEKSASNTYLQEAIFSNNFVALTWLLQKGAIVGQRTTDNYTELQLAIVCGNPKIYQHLLLSTGEKDETALFAESIGRPTFFDSLSSQEEGHFSENSNIARLSFRFCDFTPFKKKLGEIYGSWMLIDIKEEKYLQKVQEIILDEFDIPCDAEGRDLYRKSGHLEKSLEEREIDFENTLVNLRVDVSLSLQLEEEGLSEDEMYQTFFQHQEKNAVSNLGLHQMVHGSSSKEEAFEYVHPKAGDNLISRLDWAGKKKLPLRFFHDSHSPFYFYLIIFHPVGKKTFRKVHAMKVDKDNFLQSKFEVDSTLYLSHEGFLYRDCTVEIWAQIKKTLILSQESEIISDNYLFRDCELVGRGEILLDPVVTSSELIVQISKGVGLTSKLYGKVKYHSGESGLAGPQSRYVSFPITDRFSSLKELVGKGSVGKILSQLAYTPVYPVVIVPGFCSSALEVLSSYKFPAWEKTRVWIDPMKIGNLAMYQKLRTKKTNDPVSRQWLKHIALAEDGFSDPEGIKVRPVSGFSGCDYLVEQTLIRPQSYVLGPLIANLLDLGYEARNLVAATYDWRLPPTKLQERDGYFTYLFYQISSLREINRQRVVLMGHSMGNKVIHYFLLWAEKNKGKKWIDENVHSFMALGAPFLGAPKAVRSVVSGDRLDLEVFLTSSEGLAMCRRMATLPWLFPVDERYLPDVIGRVKRSGHYQTQKMASLLDSTSSDSWNFFKTFFQKDDLYLLCDDSRENSSVVLPPPVMRPPSVDHIWNIYGINMKTEVSFYYKDVEQGPYLDHSAEQFSQKKSVDNPREFYISGGIAYETAKTYQPVIRAHKSGDGTVPYCSLYYASSWRSQTPGDGLPHVQTVEIPGVEHRAMLQDDYVTFRILELLSERERRDISATSHRRHGAVSDS